MRVHLIILPTLLMRLRSRTVKALCRVCLMRAGASDTLKRGVWARATLRVAGRGWTCVVPRRVHASTPVTAGRVGAA